MIRNRHKVGDYLMVCDDSGMVDYASNMVKRWDGAWVRKKFYEDRHPQEFIRAKADPTGVPVSRPAIATTAISTAFALFIGRTVVRSPVGPAAHLFGGAPAVGYSPPTTPVGIGTAIIAHNFIVS